MTIEEIKSEESVQEEEHSNYPSSEIESAAELAAERDEYKDRWLRQLAEVENYKKRAEREKIDFLRRANEGIVKDLLPILDDLERALTYVKSESESNSLVHGISMTYQELVKILGRYGLEKIEALGQPFNPDFHEAMLQQEDFVQDENIILDELSKGYIFHGRLLRPAMVVINKKSSSTDDEGQKD